MYITNTSSSNINLFWRLEHRPEAMLFIKMSSNVNWTCDSSPLISYTRWFMWHYVYFVYFYVCSIVLNDFDKKFNCLLIGLCYSITFILLCKKHIASIPRYNHRDKTHHTADTSPLDSMNKHNLGVYSQHLTHNFVALAQFLYHCISYLKTSRKK